MKNYIILSVAFAILLTGCSKIDQDIIETGDCLVSFNLIGEITTEDTPLTRSSSDDIYIVQVYQGTTYFAFGIFDDSTKIKFNLKKGSGLYRFIVSIIKNGKSLPHYENDMLYGGNGYSYAVSSAEGAYYPINITYYNSVGGVTVYWNINKSSWTTLPSASRYGLPYIGTAKTDAESYPVCTDWFYGEINNYSPTGEFETLNVDLKRVGFKLKYEVSGITDGKVMLKIYNSSRTFVQDTLSSEGGPHSIEPRFYAYYDLHSAWQYADDYMENFTLAVSWLRGVGVTEDYGTKTIQLKRNCLNNVRISMTSNDQTAGMNLDVESEDSIGSDQYVIPVQ